MRKHYIDTIRSLTIVVVVIYHLFYLFNGVAPEGTAGPFHPGQKQDVLLYVLYPWIMVILFIVSGMSARWYLEGHSGREFARSRTVKLLVPSTLGLLVFQWVQGAVSMALSGAFAQMSELPGPALYLVMCLSGTGVLWFIQLLWVYSLLLLALRALERGRLLTFCGRFHADSPRSVAAACALLALLGVAAWGAFQVLNAPVIVVYRCGLYGFVFFLGYYFFSQESVLDFLARIWPVTLAGATVCCTLYTVQEWGRNYAQEPVVNAPLTTAYLWLACLAILGVAKRFGDRTGPVWEFLRRKSWGLYVFHYLPLSAVALALKGTAVPPAVQYLVAGAASVIGALFLYEVISRIPVVRWCVLGLGKSCGRH